MKKIIVSIPNALLTGGVVMYLKKNPDFKVYREDNPSGIEGLCIASKADVLLAEVRERPPHTLDEWNIRVWIDDFLFYDTSVNYLFSKLESLFQ